MRYLGWVCLIAVALPLAARAEEPQSAAEAKAAYTEQLLEVLSQTRSTDTFLVTLTLLAESKADPRVIPVVLMHAERLGIFENHLAGDDDTKARLADGVKEMILQIQKPGSKTSSPRYSNAPPSPVTSYRSPTGQVPACEPATPLLPPVPPGQAPPPVSPPSEAQILKALGKLAPDRPLANVEIVTEKLVDRLDPPRFYPLVGPAQLRHVSYKCTVYYCEPEGKPRSKVVYIDKDQLHQVVAAAGERGASAP